MTEIEAKVMELADKYLQPFQVKNRQVVPKTCPFCHGGDHGDQGTFAIGLYNGAYNCMRGSCAQKGTLRDFCNKLGERCDVSTEYSDRIVSAQDKAKKRYALPDESMLMPLTEDAIKYFESRKISKETLDFYHMACNAEGNIVFPFYRDDKLVYTKFRSPYPHTAESRMPKEWAGRDEESILFGMDKATDITKPLYITEGMIDALALHEAGVENVTSVPSGCKNTDWILNCYTWLEQFQEIVIFGDNDAPGVEMVETVSKRLGEDRCKYPPEYPKAFSVNEDGEVVDIDRLCKDANEILTLYGKEELYRIASEIHEVPITGILDLADVQFVDPTSLPRIYTRIQKLDEMIGGLAEGTVTVFTGKRGSGKSTLNGTLLLNAVDQGHKVCAYSGELSAQKFLEWIMLQATPQEYITVKQDPRTQKLYPYVPEDVQLRIRQWIRGNFFLFDNAAVLEGKQTEAILRIFEIAAKKYGCDVFLCDNLMIALCNGEEEQTKAQAKFAAQLKAFATKYKARVILVAHPRKTQSDRKIDNDDVSGSSAITNLADTVITVNKPNLEVIKNREFGETGTIVCDFNPVNRRIIQQDIGDRFNYRWNKEGIDFPEIQAMSFPEFAVSHGSIPGVQVAF